MSDSDKPSVSASALQGEFFTDGATYVFRIKGSPLAGRGPTAQAAFDDLMGAVAASPEFGRRFEELAREQRSETLRATLVRWTMIALIVFGSIGGVMVSAFALAPKMADQLLEVTTHRLTAWVDGLSAEQRAAIADLKDKAGGLVEGEDAADPVTDEAAPPPAP